MIVITKQLGEMAAKPDATVTDRISTFSSMKLLDIFDKTLGHFPSVCGNRTRLAKT